MQRRLLTTAMLLVSAGAFGLSAQASQLVEARLDTKLMPGPVEYNVLLPDGYDSAKEPLPLLLFLHGGGGDRAFLTRLRPAIDDVCLSQMFGNVAEDGRRNAERRTFFLHGLQRRLTEMGVLHRRSVPRTFETDTQGHARAEGNVVVRDLDGRAWWAETRVQVPRQV